MANNQQDPSSSKSSGQNSKEEVQGVSHLLNSTEDQPKKDDTAPQNPADVQPAKNEQPAGEADRVDALLDKDSSKQKTDEKLYDIEDLENIIKELDPDFFKELGDIGPNEEWDGVNLSKYDLDAPDVKTFRERLIYLKEYLKNKFYLAMIFIEHLVYYFFMKFVPATAIKTKNLILKSIKFISEKIRAFSFLPLKIKLKIFFSLFGAGLVSYYAYFISTHQILKEKDHLFVTSMEEWAQETYKYEPDEVEPFYSSTRAMQNIMSLPRMVANIKRSVRSGPNPMVALELYFEGTTPEGVVEIKDRDYEIKDRILRTLEESTFDQLDSGEGKHVLLEKIKRDINQVLTKGKVRRIFYKSIILKP